MNLYLKEESVSISLWPEITYFAKLVKCCVFISDTHHSSVTEREREREREPRHLLVMMAIHVYF